MTGILFHFSIVLLGFSFAMLLPVAVAAASGDTGALFDFFLIAAMSGFCALSFLFALQGRRSAFGRMQSFLLLILCWVVLGLIGALPFAIAAGLPLVDSVFESFSGLTTTGATVFTNLADHSLAIIFWRAELQWLGGLLTLLSITLISAPAGIGGLPDRHIRLAESPEGIMGHRVVNAVRDIAGLYLLTTVACMIFLLLSGIPPIDALCLALATVSTGGFVPIDGNISSYGNPYAEIALIIFIASILIPILKMLSLATLCLVAGSARPEYRGLQHSLYRITEYIGRWSMVDVFVVALLVALVQGGLIMSAFPGPAALAFCAVVVLTMLAARAFDAKLIWRTETPAHTGRHTEITA